MNWIINRNNGAIMYKNYPSVQSWQRFFKPQPEKTPTTPNHGATKNEQ
jgi:hypothetical protein